MSPTASWTFVWRCFVCGGSPLSCGLRLDPVLWTLDHFCVLQLCQAPLTLTEWQCCLCYLWYPHPPCCRPAPSQTKTPQIKMHTLNKSSSVSVSRPSCSNSKPLVTPCLRPRSHRQLACSVLPPQLAFADVAVEQQHAVVNTLAAARPAPAVKGFSPLLDVAQEGFKTGSAETDRIITNPQGQVISRSAVGLTLRQQAVCQEACSSRPSCGCLSLVCSLSLTHPLCAHPALCVSGCLCAPHHRNHPLHNPPLHCVCDTRRRRGSSRCVIG